VLFSVWETRVKDYQAFCDASKRPWKKPDFPQTDDHPAVNVSWEDATAFCEWLSQKEGKKYRLPSDHEWSCAVGIGGQEDGAASPKSKDGKIDNVFPWGEQWPPPNDAGNYFGEECKTPAGLAALKAAGYDPSNWTVIEGFNDGQVFTAEVGSFRTNTNRVRPFACCAAVRGTLTTATTCCRPSASATTPLIATRTSVFVWWLRLVSGARC
jgi:formylglycine-generating enzyme required for sulfatase activity